MYIKVDRDAGVFIEMLLSCWSESQYSFYWGDEIAWFYNKL